MAKPTYEWFIEPLDDFTNDSIRREVPAENTYRELLDNNGKPRKVWQCSYEQVRYFWASRDCGLNFRIFNRPVTSQSKGRIKDVTFIFQHPRLQKKIKLPKKLSHK